MADEGMEAYFETSSNAEALRRAGAGEDHIVTAQEMKNSSLTELTHSSPHLFSHPPMKSNATSTPLNKQEAVHIRILVEEIMKSALLTEDDCVLLESVLKIEGMSDPTEKRINYLFNNWWYIYISSLVMVLSMFFSYSACLLVFIFTVTGFTLFKARETRSEGRMRKEREGIKNYLIKMESLLNLIMKSLNTIRERELVYHGFLRPVRGLSASHIESQLANGNSNSFQCHSLRERLHQVCSKGKEMMGSVTVSLINGYPLNTELDNKDTYLLYRELPAVQDEHVLSLEALKDAASLMAIVNSEMLRRLCLVLGRHLITEQSVLDKTDKRLSLSTAFQFLKPLYEHVDEALTQIQWSLDYQNHKYTTKDGSTDNSPATNGSKKAGFKGAGDKPLSSIEAELHAADLHVHTTLIKLRELSDDSSGEVWEEEIRSILSNITSAEHHLQQVLSELSQPAPPPSPPLATSTPNFVNIEDNNEETEVPCNTQETANDDDEEMIYEAYVSGLDQISQLEEQEIVSNEEWRKTSLNILHELKSVLSVRKAMKEKKRRKKDAVEETPLPKENAQDQSDSVEHNNTQTNNSNEAGSSSSCLQNSPEKSKDIHSDDEGRIATGAVVDGSGDQLLQLQLMARAAAASKRRQQNEEIFELSDNDDEND